MSLINEALKRARIEAARHDAAEKGVPSSALPVYVPRRQRPWLAPLIGFLLGLTVVGVAAGAWWMARRPSAEPTGPEPPAVAVAEPAPRLPAQPSPREPATLPPPTEIPAAVPPPAVPPPAVPPPPRSPVEAPTPRAPVVETTPRASAVDPVAEPSRPAPVPAAVVEAPPTVAPSPPPAAGGESGEGQVYRVEVRPAGGEPVKLDFIVWSESSPFAQINGELVNPGQQINGYTLLTVERDRVELEGAGAKFWLRVR